MPSFDIVSEVDIHELTNAVDQANRELAKKPQAAIALLRGQDFGRPLQFDNFRD